jgi:hypothetical protein
MFQAVSRFREGRKWAVLGVVVTTVVTKLAPAYFLWIFNGRAVGEQIPFTFAGFRAHKRTCWLSWVTLAASLRLTAVNLI